MYEDLVEHVTLGVCYETHRAAKLGYLFLEESAIQEWVFLFYDQDNFNVDDIK